LPVVVISDADMLFGGTTRALFIYLDYAKNLHMHWSQRILTEMSVALVKTNRKPDMAAALANEALMNASLPAALMSQPLVDAHLAIIVPLVNDPNDAHVAACAHELLTGAYYPGTGQVGLVTRNLSDYKIPQLAAAGIIVRSPDAFLMTLPVADVAAAFRNMRLDIKSNTPAVAKLLGRLLADGNPQIVAAPRAGEAVGAFVL
jgi:hypothetical protein